MTALRILQRLSELVDDVTISSIANNNLLRYNSSTSKWENIATSGTGTIGYWSRTGTQLRSSNGGDSLYVDGTIYNEDGITTESTLAVSGLAVFQANIDLNDSNIVDLGLVVNATKTIIDGGNQTLNESFDGATTLNWGSGLLINPEGGTVVNWLSGLVNDTDGNPNIDLNNRQLKESSGNVQIDYATDGTVDINAILNINYGGNSILGGDINLAQRTDATTKVGRVGFPHYLNAEQPMAGFYGITTVNGNILAIGGGSSTFNAATEIVLYTAANNTTTTGTIRLEIDSLGDFDFQAGDLTTTGRLSVSSGTLALPGIYFDNDTNTGIYRVSENAIGLSAGGVELLWNGGNLALTQNFSAFTAVATAVTAAKPAFSMTGGGSHVAGMYRINNGTSNLQLATEDLPRVSIDVNGDIDFHDGNLTTTGEIFAGDIGQSRTHTFSGNGYPVLVVNRGTNITNSKASGMQLKTTSAGNMSDGFGGGFAFVIEDAGATESVAAIYGIRDGADNSGKLAFDTFNAGSQLTRWEIASDGHLSANAAYNITTTGNLFIGVKSGATQVAAGAAANEVWKTSSHATLPDNVLLIGV